MKNEERDGPGNDKEKNTLHLKKAFLFIIFIANSKLNLKLFTLNVDIWPSVLYMLLVLNSVRDIYTKIVTNSTSWKYRVLQNPPGSSFRSAEFKWITYGNNTAK